MAESRSEIARSGQGRGDREREGAMQSWDPFRELGFGGTRLGQILDEFFAPVGQGGAGQRRGWPAVDVDEDEDAYRICLEVPGVRREDIDVEIQQGMLTVRGEKRREEGRRPRWNERVYGAFVRTIRLPSDAETEHAEASFSDGVLTLRFPKSEEAKPRRIEVTEAPSRQGSTRQGSTSQGSKKEGS